MESGCGNAMFSLFLVLILGGFFSLKLPRSPWDLTFFLFLSKKKLFSFAWLIQIKHVLIQKSNQIEMKFQRVQISLIDNCLFLFYAYRKQYFLFSYFWQAWYPRFFCWRFSHLNFLYAGVYRDMQNQEKTQSLYPNNVILLSTCPRISGY